MATGVGRGEICLTFGGTAAAAPPPFRPGNPVIRP